jgi:Holliday junction resolvase-like predicted endonuclease
MKFVPKNLCTKLSVVNGIGVCNLRKCLCQCWNCEIKEKCGFEAFERCPLKSDDFKEIPSAISLYEQAIRNADKKIRSIVEKGNRTEVLGGLLFRRETEILHCFFEAPGDLPSAISTANSYINEDLSVVKHGDVKYTELADEIWNLIVVKELFMSQVSRLQNRDIICYGNKNGEDELQCLVDNPVQDIEKLREAVQKKSPHLLESPNVRLVYSREMQPILEWCNVNIHQANMLDYTLYENFHRILDHLEEVSKSGEISPSVCYKLAYPHYAGMLHTCRYVYSKFTHIKDISQLNKDIYQAIKEKYSTTFDVGKNYDSFLFDLWLINRNEKMCISESIGTDTKDYRYIIGDGALLGSLLLLGFISKNFESICLKPYERGRLFEDYSEKELLDRQVTIVKKNLQIPDGEIDFICSKKGKAFLIEAKDYNPWFDDSYIGSETYNRRIETINEKLEKLPYRLQWIESHPQDAGLSTLQRIQGLILTRFSEPHLRIPARFQLVQIDDLDRIFGESIHKKIYETNIKFRMRIPEERRQEVEESLLKNAITDFNKYGLR